MTTRVTIICAVAAVWCLATAVKAAIALIQREKYVVSWWDAGVAGTGRALDRARTVIKMVTMIAIAPTCVLALLGQIAPKQVWYVVVPAVVISALSELTAPKPKRGR